MPDPHFERLAAEVAGIRLVLVHALARLGYDEIKAVSESVHNAFSQPRPSAGIGAVNDDQAERWALPYRRAVDDLLAQAIRIHGEPK